MCKLSNKQFISLVLSALLITASAMNKALAQLPTATILGTIRDTSGAVVPSANLTVRNTETGLVRTATSASDGSYRFSALPVGSYEIRVETAGFQTEVRSGLTLTVGQEAVVNVALQVGAIEQTVEVTAEAPLVNTTSGSLGGLVDEKKVAELPLNGRNYVDLAFLQPGIQPERRTGGGPVMAGQFFSSNGAPPRSNNFLLDGAIMQSSNDTSSASSTNATLGVEGIREFRVVSNAASAEYGMRMGSQLVLVSKSGTNDFHGSLFEYLRNSALDARNFFDRKNNRSPEESQRRLPAFTRNQFGGSVGGPIKTDKTFFHAVYESLRERTGQTLLFNTIPQACRVPGSICPLITAGTPPVAQPTPQIAPIVRPLIDIYPVANLGNDQVTLPFNQPSDEHYGQARVDHNFSGDDSLFVRYTVDSAERLLAPGIDGFPSTRPSRSQFGTISETHIFSPALLNTFRYSYSRTKLASENPTTEGPQYAFVPGQGLGSINPGSGISAIGNGTNASTTIQNVFTWSDDVNYARGSHSLKFGSLINRFQPWLLTGTNVRGVIRFANLQAFLNGQTNNVTAVTPGSIIDRTYRYTTLGFYGQDDWRVTSRLTLNLGLRYEFHTNFTERFGQGAALRDMIADRDTTVGDVFVNPSHKNFSPRVGFAWDVRGDGKTAVRGGFGLLYDVAGGFMAGLKISTVATPPFSSQSTVSTTQNLTIPLTFPPEAVGRGLRLQDYHMQQPHLLSYNLTMERQLPFNMGFTIAYAGTRGINVLQAKEGNPTIPLGVPQNGACVPRPAGSTYTVDGPKCWLGIGIDPRTNPNWTNIELVTASASSWYNSMQLSLQKRLSQGLEFQSSFTWSKALDEGQQVIVGDTSDYPSDPTDRRVDKGLAGFDIRGNWRFNAIYRIPQWSAASGIKDKLANGWWISTIWSVQSGFAVTPDLTSNRSRSNNNNAFGGPSDRPNLLPGRTSENITEGTTAGCPGITAGQKLHTPDLYFDPCAFESPAAGFLGTSGKGIFSGPGTNNLDFSVVKDTALGWLGEGGKLEFRTEVFNILNRATFDLPS
ncbi:MAG TPA: TonB-dependent receptor, partial [Bryobacteraceae bacterium]|nr:TonB-dependent receptor [Bryobacteraceae bacterium]